VLAQTQKTGFRAHFIRHTIPLRAANGTEKNGIGSQCLLHIRVGNRLAMRVIGRTANQTLFGLETEIEARVEESDNLADFRHRLWTDAVAGQEKEFSGCHIAKPLFYFAYSAKRKPAVSRILRWDSRQWRTAWNRPPPSLSSS